MLNHMDEDELHDWYTAGEAVWRMGLTLSTKSRGPDKSLCIKLPSTFPSLLLWCVDDLVWGWAKGERENGEGEWNTAIIEGAGMRI